MNTSTLCLSLSLSCIAALASTVRAQPEGGHGEPPVIPKPQSPDLEDRERLEDEFLTRLNVGPCWTNEVNRWVPITDRFVDDTPEWGTAEEAFTASLGFALEGYARAFDVNPRTGNGDPTDPDDDAVARSFSFVGLWDLYWTCSQPGWGEYDGVISAAGEVLMDDTAGTNRGDAGGAAYGRLSLYSNLTRQPSYHVFIDAAAAESRPNMLEDMLDPAAPYGPWNTDNPWGLAQGSGLTGPRTVVQGLRDMIETNSLVGPFVVPGNPATIDPFLTDEFGLLPLDKLYLLQWGTLTPSGRAAPIREAWVNRQTSLEVRARAEWAVRGNIGIEVEAYITGFNEGTITLGC